MAIIELYESQRTSHEREIDVLKDEVKRLNSELRQLENFTNSPVRKQRHKTSQSGNSLDTHTQLRIERVHKKQLERAAMLRAKETELQAKTQAVRKELVTLTSYCKELEEHNENLRLEIKVTMLVC